MSTAIDFKAIKSAVSLADYCREHNINLRRNGVNLVGLCPLHTEDTPSFTVFPDGHFYCYGCSAHGDVIDLDLALHGGTKMQAAYRLVPSHEVSLRFKRPPSNYQGKNRHSFNWNNCVSTVTDEDLETFVRWRGYLPEFCQWLRDKQLLGRYQGQWATPVLRDEKIVGAHYRVNPQTPNGKTDWRYTPGCTAQLIVICGKLKDAQTVYCFESQWDQFALIDKLRLNEAIGIATVSTRGASNAKLLHGIPQDAQVILWPQNDEPGQDWLEKAITVLGNHHAKIVRIPKQFKDLNDWVKAGATVPDIQAAIDSAKEAMSEDAIDPGADAQKTQRPRVRLPTNGRVESEFSNDVGKILGKLEVSCRYNGRAVEIENEEFTGVLDRFKIAEGGLKFKSLTPIRLKTWLEQFIETGSEIEKKGVSRFEAKTISKSLAESVLISPQFLKHVPHVARIIDVPIPIRTKNDEIIFPKPGLNKEVGIFLNPNAPTLCEMPLEEAIQILEKAHSGFCWRNDNNEKLQQSKIHAFARILTPFARGLIGFNERVPLWFYDGNRPRCGKDYLAGVSQIVYLSHAFEDAALSRNPEETHKRITAALRNGRRFMHFANCQYTLDDPYLIQAITGTTYGSRALGSNEAEADLQLLNEIDYSLSANSITYREDVEPRIRKIALAYFEENENGRIFPNPRLHEWVSDNRAEILSAIYSIFTHWIKVGCSMGKTPFISFPRWAEIVGGVMAAANLGDPCLQHEGEDLIGGDQRDRSMRALFSACHTDYSDEWIKKLQIYDVIRQQAENQPALEWFGFGQDKDRSAATKTGQALSAYRNRVLGGVRLLMDVSNKDSQSWRYKFSKK
jgi:hypothetical protein